MPTYSLAWLLLRSLLASGGGRVGRRPSPFRDRSEAEPESTRPADRPGTPKAGNSRARKKWPANIPEIPFQISPPPSGPRQNILKIGLLLSVKYAQKLLSTSAIISSTSAKWTGVML